MLCITSVTHAMQDGMEDAKCLMLGDSWNVPLLTHLLTLEV